MTETLVRVVLLVGSLAMLALGAFVGMGAVVVCRSSGLMAGSFIGVMATLMTGSGIWLTYSVLTGQLSPQTSGPSWPGEISERGDDDAGWEDVPAGNDPAGESVFEGEWDASD